MFSLPDLPYDYDALSPVISEETMHFHHDKHHATYVKTLNDPAGDLRPVVRHPRGGDRRRRGQDAEEAVQQRRPGLEPRLLLGVHEPRQAASRPANWPTPSARPSAAGTSSRRPSSPAGSISSVPAGSGSSPTTSGALKVVSTHDADNTLVGGVGTPLIVCDVWEHAYYLDYQNERKGFLEAWFDALPNWDLAARQFAAAKGSAKAWTFADAGQ